MSQIKNIPISYKKSVQMNKEMMESLLFKYYFFLYYSKFVIVEESFFNFQLDTFCNKFEIMR